MNHHTADPDSKPNTFDAFMKKVLGASVLDPKEFAQANMEPPKNVPRKSSKKSSNANAAFMKPMLPNAHLASIVGTDPLPRTEVVSKLWVYIKAHKLQDQINRRLIHCDENLFLILGKREVTLFELASLIGKSLTPLGRRRSRS